jgi:pimeloyl-ACP methyl ester carboxylesterase
MNFAPNARALAQVVPFRRLSQGMGEGAPATTDAVQGGQAASGHHSRELPVLFLHGWGVGPHSYGAPLANLQELGCQVMAPALPGFGGAPALGDRDCNFSGYARWAASYLDSLEIEGPVTLIGHSFGGGVAVQLASDHPERVATLVLCNAVGGSPWDDGRGSPAVGDRPWWEWGRILGADLLSVPSVMRVLPALLGEAVPNLVSNPLAMWRVGEFVRRARLLDELTAATRRGVPVTVVWSDRDRLVPLAGFAALCRAAGVKGQVVAGAHSWLIAEPRRFADIVLRAMVEAGVVQSALVAAG